MWSDVSPSGVRFSRSVTTPTGGGTTFQAPHSPGAAAFKGDTNAKTDTVFKDSSEFLVRR